MYKGFLLLVLLIELSLFVMCTSCSDFDNNVKFEYSLNSEGNADGCVMFQIVTADLKLTGNTEYNFSISSDKFKDTLTKTKVGSLNEALNSNNSKELKAAIKVNDWITDMIKVIEADGNYNIHIYGYVMETSSGFKFMIDKYFSNN